MPLALSSTNYSSQQSPLCAVEETLGIEHGLEYDKWNNETVRGNYKRNGDIIASSLDKLMKGASQHIPFKEIVPIVGQRRRYQIH